MPEEIDRAIKFKSIIMGHEGYTQPEIAQRLGISESTVKRAKRAVRGNGDIEKEKKKPGRKRKVDAYMEEVCSLDIVSNSAGAFKDGFECSVSVLL
jgi:transposase